MVRLSLFLFWVGLGYLGSPHAASAKDVRMALLVAHQQGWHGEPRLKYVVEGDLLPMAKTLRGVGFQVKTLQNPTPAQMREAMRQLQLRMKQGPRISTFLFYYSGHADKNYFHLGPKTNQPLGYGEFADFFEKLPVSRRFAIFDSCYSGEIIRKFGSVSRYRKLLKEGQLKGVRMRKRSFDLSKLNLPKQGNEYGIRIISSSLGVAWEVHRYKASVFTYHFLRGLRGHADLDQDGKITIDELFDFASRSVLEDTGQKPEQLILTRRNTPYALAPAYRSRLRIGSDVVGKIRVSVSNFVWSQVKQNKQPLRLAVVSGKGSVELRRDQDCWRQNIHFPKNGEVGLGTKWKRIVCQKMARVQKGQIQMPALSAERPLSTYFPWSLSLAADVSVSPSRWAGGDFLGGGSIGIHYWLFGLRLGVWGTTATVRTIPFRQLYLEMRPEIGARFDWKSLDFFVGGYASLGVLLQDINGDSPNTGMLFRYGATLSSSFWFLERWGAFAGVDAGFAVLPRGSGLEQAFDLSVRLGMTYRF